MHQCAHAVDGAGFVIAIGNVPPPVTGKTVVTQAVFEQLKRRAMPNVLIVSPTVVRNRLLRLFQKCFWLARGLAVSVKARLGGRAVRAYIVADSGNGVFVSAVFAWLFSFVAKDLVIHHHGAKWMSKRSRILGVLLFRPGSTHVTQCTKMSGTLLRCYPRVMCQELSNAFVVDAAVASAKQKSAAGARPFYLCHLSNLTLEKGLGRVIETFEMLKRRGRTVALRIGGPPVSTAARELLDAARERHSEIEYVFRVTDSMKPDFFSDMAAFLFPSSNVSETQGIVTLEALAYGVPLIAYPRCCLEETLSEGGGERIEEDGDFAEAAAAAIEAWIDNPKSHAQACVRARHRFEMLYEKSCIERERLIGRLCSPVL